MSDTYRRYRAIRTALLQCFGTLKEHQMRPLNTLVALICGLVDTRHVHLSKGAGHCSSPRPWPTSGWCTWVSMPRCPPGNVVSIVATAVT